LIPSEIIQSYTPILEKNWIQYDNVIDYLNSTIKSVDFPGISFERPKQNLIRGKERYYKPAINIQDIVSSRDLSITFASVDADINYWLAFDIVSKIDGQTLDNAINTAKKEILNRYDFNDSKSSVELDKKSNEITIITENDMRLKAIQDAIISRMVKHNLDPSSMDLGKEEYASGNMLRKEIKIKEGIDKEVAKKIVKKIKDIGLKVQASIMDDQLRVQGKKIDDLQSVISLCRAEDFGQPIQYINMRN
jgi:uncharacterized protein YajQ (UPF0234 family)